MGCSMPDFPVLHHLLELAHTHLHWVSDVFLPSGPLSSPSPPAFNLSQHQSFLMSRLFTSGGPSMEFQLQHQSFQWIIRTDFLWDWLVWSPCSSRDAQESSPTPQFKSINSSSLSLLSGSTLASIHDSWKNYSITFIVHFISNVMPLLIWWEVPVGLWPRGWGPLLENIIVILKIISMKGKSLDTQ